MFRTIYLSLLLFPINLLLAQTSKVKNLKQFEARKIHFGISVGINSGSFALQRKDYRLTTDSLASINVINQGGFNINIISNLRLGQFFHLRFVPGLVIGQRNLEFNFINSQGNINTVFRELESSYFEFPLQVKYSSVRLNNFAAYVVTGGKYSIDFDSNEMVNNEVISEPIIKLKKHTYSAEVGVGSDFFLPYFKFALEIKMSYTLSNALVADDTVLSNSIDRIVPKMFFINMSFEGSFFN